MFYALLMRVDFVVYFRKKCTTVSWDCNVWWKFFATNFTTNWVFLQKGCCSRIFHLQSSKSENNVSTWWLEEQIKKENSYFNSHTWSVTRKKHYFAHEYLFNGELVGGIRFNGGLNLTVMLRTWRRVLFRGGHGWKCLDPIFDLQMHYSAIWTP